MAKELNRHFSEEDTQMASKHMKRCLTLFNTREIAATVSCHFIPTRLAITKERQQQVLVRSWRSQSPRTLLVGM